MSRSNRFLGTVGAIQLLPDLGDPGEGTGVLVLLLAEQKVGMEVSVERLLGPAGGEQAVSQRIVGGGLGGGVLGAAFPDHGHDGGLSLGVLF